MTFTVAVPGTLGSIRLPVGWSLDREVDRATFVLRSPEGDYARIESLRDIPSTVGRLLSARADQVERFEEMAELESARG